MSNGRIDEILGPQQQLSGSLIIIELAKTYSFLLWKSVHFQRGALEGVFPISHTIIRKLIIKFRPRSRYQTAGFMK